MVFCVSLDKVDELLGKVSQHPETEKLWNHFLTKQVAPWKERQQPSNNRKVYVKVWTKTLQLILMQSSSVENTVTSSN